MKKMILVLVLVLFSSIAFADEPVIVKGEDSSGFKRVLRTNTSGQLEIVSAGGSTNVVITGPLGSAAAAASVSIAPPTDARFQVSKDANANAINNAIAVQISQDGTNAVDATHPLPVSANLAVNAINNAIAVQISQDGTNAVDATHPLPVSANLAVNAANNALHMLLSNGTSTIGDSLATPVFTQLTDGTNVLSITGSGQIEVYDSAVKSWQHVSDGYEDTRRVSVEQYAPATTVGITVDSTKGGDYGDEVWSSTGLDEYTNWSVQCWNLGAVALNDSWVLVTLDATYGYAELSQTALNLAAGATAIYESDNAAIVAVKVEALTAASSTTVRCRLVANAG